MRAASEVVRIAQAQEVDMAVLREWRAEIRRELKHEYVEYVRDTGIAEYRALPGNLGAVVATRDLDEERSKSCHFELVDRQQSDPDLRG